MAQVGQETYLFREFQQPVTDGFRSNEPRSHGPQTPRGEYGNEHNVVYSANENPECGGQVPHYSI